MKGLLRFVGSVLGIVLTLLIVFLLTNQKEEKVIEYVEVDDKQIEETKNKTVEKEAVLNAIRGEVLLVGLVGDVSKTVKYEDNKWTGKKEYVMKLNGTYKLGYDMKKLLFNTERIIVHKNKVTVVVPDIKIISLELPYNKVVMKEDNGWLRKELTDQQKQAMYKKARSGLIEDILNNKKVIKQAHKQTNQALKEIIMKINGVKRVDFVY